MIPPDQPTDERLSGLQDGTPLLDETTVRWDAAPLRRQCRRLLKVFLSPSLSHLDGLGDLQRLLARRDGDPVDWARSFLRDEFGGPRPELVIGGYVLQPFLYVFARRVLPRLSREEWGRNRCPVCGGCPYHGYLDPESRRKVLICGKCLCPWSAPRLQCAFCGDTLQEHLGYFYEEQAPRQRVDFCTDCRSILPITLESESNRSMPLHDHLSSLPFLAAVERRSHDDQPS